MVSQRHKTRSSDSRSYVPNHKARPPTLGPCYPTYCDKRKHCDLMLCTAQEQSSNLKIPVYLCSPWLNSRSHEASIHNCLVEGSPFWAASTEFDKQQTLHKHQLNLGSGIKPINSRGSPETKVMRKSNVHRYIFQE